MSINAVMLCKRPSQPFIPLSGEKIQLVTSPRTSLELKGMGVTANEMEPFKLNCNQGTAFITSGRIIFLPVTVSQQFESFTVEILRIVDSHVKAPWIGPNSWVAKIERSRSSCRDIWNIPKHIAALHISIIFNDGGAYDFDRKFRSAKERIFQAIEVRNMTSVQNRSASFDSVNLDSIYLEQLPAYEDNLNPTSRSDDESIRYYAGQDIATNGAGIQRNEPSANSQMNLEPRHLYVNTSEQEQQAELPPDYEEMDQSTTVSTRVSVV